MKSALLLHGAGGGGWEWNVWRDVLRAQGIGIAAPDLRPAAAGWAATGWADYLAQARGALRELPRPRAAIGASLGGLLVAAIADAADALVMVNPLPPAPYDQMLPHRDEPAIVPWRRDARLASTRRAMNDADGAASLYVYRSWRDESGAVLRVARSGIQVPTPRCPALCLVSGRDEDIPPDAMLRLAAHWGADLIVLKDASHLSPLLGRGASDAARQAAAWLSAR